jgi:superfamily II DNA or RNA helicase
MLILFSKSIAMAEEISELFGDEAKTYHSKMKPEERRLVLTGFSNSEFNILSAVDGLNEGLSVDDVDAAICISGVSTILTNTQQLGQFGLYLINSVKPKSIRIRQYRAKQDLRSGRV